MDIDHHCLVVKPVFSSVFAALLLIGISSAVAEIPPISDALEEKQVRLRASFPDKQWQFFSGKKDASLADTWSVVEDSETKTPVLICRGEPHGYLRTAVEFTNFDMELEWKYPHDADGNSGILLFMAGEDQVWPASLQVQLHQPELGSTFPIGGAKSGNEIRTVEKLAKPVNTWNRCEIRCRKGTVSVTINNRLVGEVAGCSATSGAIGLQSEGSEIHFRAISIREIPIAQIDQLSADSQAADGSSSEKK